jgi:ABC-type transport system involved in multi-copper enzyme maturation permease subunit
MITQTLAIFVDAYRELNARKMFWIVLAISALIVLAFAALGINERGITFLWVTFNAWTNTETMSKGSFYKALFEHLGMLWLTPWASILALISTASIFPDFLTGGSVDLFLAKPIGRLRLFLTKYFAGLMFVALQVFVFCLSSFLVIGVRGHEWQVGLFLAVPLVVCYFSYLYCVSVLIGVMARSTLAAILIATVFFLLVLGIHIAESYFLLKAADEQHDALRMDQDIHVLQAEIKALDRAKTLPSTAAAALKERELAGLREERAQWKPTWQSWHQLSYRIKTVFPKLSETAELLNRWIADAAELHETPREKEPNLAPRKRGQPFSEGAMEQAAQEVQIRKVSWIIGSSLIFEAVVLALAAWIFCRRDY